MEQDDPWRQWHAERDGEEGGPEAFGQPDSLGGAGSEQRTATPEEAGAQPEDHYYDQDFDNDDGSHGGGGDDLGGHFDSMAIGAYPDHGVTAASATEPTYDFPGEAACGSPGGGFGATSMSIGEEIDVNTTGLIEETVQRLSFVHGVLGVLIIDRDGLIVHATMPMDEAAQLTGPVLSMLNRARAVAALRADDEFQMLCVRTRKHELLLCSEADGAFAVCVVQDPTPASADEANVVGAAKSQAAKAVLRGGSVLGQPSTGVTL